MIAQEGRPADVSGRLPKEVRVYDFLDSLGISYYRIDHDPAMKMEACAEIDKLLGATICKNLFLCNKQETKFYLLMIPGAKPFKTKLLSKQIGSSRLSFAPAEFMEKYLDITPGSVSILGLMNDSECNVNLIVDRDVLSGEFVGCHPCTNTSSLKIRTADMFGPLLSAMNHKMTEVTLPWVIEEEA
jgi:Ala-tRNA(Pro) deacylase